MILYLYFVFPYFVFVFGRLVTSPFITYASFFLQLWLQEVDKRSVKLEKILDFLATNVDKDFDVDKL